MSNYIVIFTEKRTNRIDYIIDFIFNDFSGIAYKIITDRNEFIECKSAKINLSHLFFDDEINFNIDDILLENDIKEVINYDDLNEFGKCFFWLSRYEEYIKKPHLFDKHNRFLGSSLDYSSPIVDLICLALQHKIKAKYPDIIFKERHFEQVNTHDVDYAWKYLYHSPKIKIGSLIKKLIKGDLKAFKQQLNILLLGKEKDPYDTFSYLEELAKRKKIKTIFFWLLGDYSTFDKNHFWKNKQQQKLIATLSNWATIGIHPSYRSNDNLDLLATEINRLEMISGVEIKKSRQHFIKLHFPQTYQQLLINGIEEDYTMGFANRIGFRAGTCTPFKWFDLSTNQHTLLTIYPFVAMDVSLKNYLQLSPKEAIEEVSRLKVEVKKVNGTFITLFHQSNLTENWSNWKKVYESIFD